MAPHPCGEDHPVRAGATECMGSSGRPVREVYGHRQDQAQDVQDPEYDETQRRYVQHIVFTLQRGNASQLCEFGATGRLKAHAATSVAEVTGELGVMDSPDHAIA